MFCLDPESHSFFPIVITFFFLDYLVIVFTESWSLLVGRTHFGDLLDEKVQKSNFPITTKVVNYTERIAVAFRNLTLHIPTPASHQTPILRIYYAPKVRSKERKEKE